MGVDGTTFMPWFKDEVLKDSTTSETLIWLANGLKFDVLCCTTYEIKNCEFYKRSLDEKSTVQNSGVTFEIELIQFSTSKYENPIVRTMSYYGVIEETWKVGCTKLFFQFLSVSELTIREWCEN